MSTCQLGDGGAEALSVELGMNTHLRFLSLAGNMIGPAGGHAVAVAASVCIAPPIIDVRHNR